jgi:hypothetical protein
MRKSYARILFGLLLPLLGGCAGETLTAYGLNVEIRDARTGASAAYDATMIVRDGSYADTVRGREMIPPEYEGETAVLAAASGRLGVYEITITHPEYQTWRVEDIRVTRSNSASPFDNSPVPKTVHVVADLQPLNEGS